MKIWKGFVNVYLKLKNKLLYILSANVFGKDIKGVGTMFKFYYIGKNREGRSSNEGLQRY